MGEQLAARPLCGAVGKSPGQPLTASQRQGLSWGLQDTLSRTSLPAGVGAGRLPEVPSTKPLGQEGSPGWKPCSQPSSCQARNRVPHKSAPHHAPLGLSPPIVQAPGPLGGWAAEGHARGCARTGLTQGRPRDEVRRPGRGGWAHLFSTYCMQAEPDVCLLPGIAWNPEREAGPLLLHRAGDRAGPAPC